MNKLFLISGPSGSGKTTIMHGIMDNEVISVTTRAMREGEHEGVDYYYISADAFERNAEQGDFVETSSYSGNRYGVLKSELDTKLSRGPAFCIVDFPGMRAMSAAYRHVVPIFIYANIGACVLNMRDRGTPNDTIMKRIATYDDEVANRVHYSYIVRNVRGKFENTVAIVKNIVEAEC